MLKSNPRTSWNTEPKMPTLSSSAYVDDAAVVIGDVRIGARVYIAPGASVRADEASPIIIGDDCNIQDGAIFHGLKGCSIELGKKVSIAHGAVVHGPAKLGDECFVGFNSVVHNSTLGRKCFVAHGAVVVGVKMKEGAFVPIGAVIDAQDKADLLGPIPENLVGFNEEVVEVNREFAECYPQGRSCDCR